MHKHDTAQQSQPPLAPAVDDGPVSKPDKAPANLPPPVVSTPAPATQSPAQATTPPTQEQPKPKPHKKPAAQKPATPAPSTTPTPAPAQPTQQTAAAGPPEVSAIGQLSTGESSDERTETQRSLAKTERGLNGINRNKLDAQQTKTSDQIREYIKQARAALDSNDIDGAKTLATKAKLLLDELTQ